ncbi:lipoyl domain-containing protein [Fulvivirga ligni]|uniref:lipoyl domain-containing protein n=1 Tax=Fulvivirga ligni TaxID=2904246 RepID=UPI001F362B71|nr:lipoyl domain-containing protein [Fulvivirga ligni]UII19114.1 lipoyl domain-containing protein [Fulvivirga ligni]
MFYKIFNSSNNSYRRSKNAEVIRMPRMSDQMEDAIVSKWFVEVGDTFKEGDILAEIETDKATMELESYDHGTMLYQVEKGQKVKVDGILAVIGNKGDEYKHLLTDAEQIAEKTGDIASLTYKLNSLLSSEDSFVMQLRYLKGCDETKLNELLQVLQDLAFHLRSRDEVPKAVVKLIMDIIPSLISCSSQYVEEEERNRINLAIDKLSHAIRKCFA